MRGDPYLGLATCFPVSSHPHVRAILPSPVAIHPEVAWPRGRRNHLGSRRRRRHWNRNGDAHWIADRFPTPRVKHPAAAFVPPVPLHVNLVRARLYPMTLDPRVSRAVPVPVPVDPVPIRGRSSRDDFGARGRWRNDNALSGHDAHHHDTNAEKQCCASRHSSPERSVAKPPGGECLRTNGPPAIVSRSPSLSIPRSSHEIYYFESDRG